ncbi:hypothetical protein [Flavobacterium soli]|uniref:hypothetical protein n=1 Tax=Flavobacterium soli TaxID=344881 RepID=UPI0012F844AF|nr:hypothetical protein [Flavobacterium soli]
MKKIAVLLFLTISTLACTTDDNEINIEVNTTEVVTDSTPPTHDKDWGKDEKVVKGN